MPHRDVPRSACPVPWCADGHETARDVNHPGNPDAAPSFWVTGGGPLSEPPRVQISPAWYVDEDEDPIVALVVESSRHHWELELRPKEARRLARALMRIADVVAAAS
jgi:hypothetical protein